MIIYEDYMDSKKILIISASFYPEISPRSFRTTELAKELSKKGHDVTVLVPLNGNDYSSFEKEHALRIKDLGSPKWKGIELKGGRIEFFLRRAIRRLLLQLFEWPDIELMFKVSRILKAENGYDLLISIAVPYSIHWGVAQARRVDRRIAECWAADCGDPYMGDTTDSFRKLFYFRYLEKWFCRKADFITVPFEGARSAYYPEFQDKIRIIPQGFQLENMNLPEYKKTCDYPVFAYAGAFIPGKRDPDPLLNFLSTCDRKFKFVVYTLQEGMLLNAKKSLKEKLEIRGIIPRDELLTILSGMDFLINFDNNTQTQLPSKLIDYSITGRPVLNISTEADFSVLLEFMNGNYSRKMNLEPPINYDIKVVAEKFTHLCKTV